MAPRSVWEEGRSAPGVEQKLPGAHTRPMEDQAVPCSPQAPRRADLLMQPWQM